MIWTHTHLKIEYQKDAADETKRKEGKDPQKRWLDKIKDFKREKFYPGPGLEPGPLAFHANALTN